MRLASLAVLVLVAVVTSNGQSIAGSLIAPTRSIGAPSGFMSACHRYSWLCSNRPGHAMGDAEAMAMLSHVNGHVNSSVRPAEDIVTSGRADYWSLPIKGKGDCEDYALEKKKELIDAGFKSDHLAMAVVLDRNGGNHAVLMARLNGGDYVLDNLSGSVKSWESTGYTFVARQSFNNKRVWQEILAGPRASQIAAADRRANGPV